MLPDNQSWMLGNTTSSSAYWTRVQDKLFEQALVIFPEETGERWRKIAGEVPGKTEWEVRRHYEDLVHDVREIESGRVELPCYADDDGDRDGDGEGSGGWDEGESKKSQISFGSSSAASKTRQCESERKKGTPWTEEEHKLFLIGLQKYGKGDWRSISRNAVVSRTPTQVASHAQKYYLRLNSGKKEKRRSSIHDITTVEDDPLSQHNHQNLVPQFHTPIWQKVQTTMPATTFPHRMDSSSVYQQQFGFPM